MGKRFMPGATPSAGGSRRNNDRLIGVGLPLTTCSRAVSRMVGMSPDTDTDGTGGVNCVTLAAVGNGGGIGPGTEITKRGLRL